jgi:hypothetical protein
MVKIPIEVLGMETPISQDPFSIIIVGFKEKCA